MLLVGGAPKNPRKPKVDPVPVAHILRYMEFQTSAIAKTRFALQDNFVWLVLQASTTLGIVPRGSTQHSPAYQVLTLVKMLLVLLVAFAQLGHRHGKAVESALCNSADIAQRAFHLTMV